MDMGTIAIGEWNTFLTLKGEKLLLVIRRHPFVVISPLFILICLLFLFIGSSFFIFRTFFASLPLFISTVLLLISSALGIMTKIIIDWYFHVYILTNRKILEFRYTPLMSYVVNDVMLDRVFCTEVDFQTNGWVHDLLDMGDIILTFDRPTHQEEFVFKDVLRCNKIGTFLAQQLIDGNTTAPITPVWFHARSWKGQVT